MIIKSDFKDFLECPRKYALKKNHTPEDAPNFVLSRRNELGVEVGRLAHQLFNNLTIIPHDISIEERLRQTQIAILEKNPVAEASFIFEDAFCAIDILEKSNNGFIIYEVKSNTKIEKPMIEDVAYQTYIAQMNGLNVIQVNIVHVNKTYIKKDSIDPQRYFKIVDVTDKVKAYISKIPSVIRSIQAQNDVPSFIPVSACKDCPFKSTCYSPLPEDSMVHLYKYNQKTKMFLKGVRALADYQVYAHKLNDIQKRQIDFHYQENPEPYLNSVALNQFIKTVEYPIYYLDFETLDYVIPLFENSAPNEKLPFQASLHIEKTPDEPLEHFESLMDPSQDPRLQMIKFLLNHIKEKGSIMVYHRTFEEGIIKTLAARFPQYQEELLKRLEWIVDLEDPFTKGMVYKKEMGNSFSIKSVYPAMIPEKKEAYKNLDTVHNGSEAMQVLEALPLLTGEAYQKARTQLLEYCKLDTLSMVEIFKTLKENLNLLMNNI